MGYGTVVTRKTELPELWSVLDEHGILATEVGEIAGCSQRRGKECMAGRKTLTIQEAIRIATACGKNFEDIAGHFVPKSIERGKR